MSTLIFQHTMDKLKSRKKNMTRRVPRDDEMGTIENPEVIELNSGVKPGQEMTDGTRLFDPLYLAGLRRSFGRVKVTSIVYTKTGRTEWKVGNVYPAKSSRTGKTDGWFVLKGIFCEFLEDMEEVDVFREGYRGHTKDDFDEFFLDLNRRTLRSRSVQVVGFNSERNPVVRVMEVEWIGETKPNLGDVRKDEDGLCRVRDTMIPVWLVCFVVNREIATNQILLSVMWPNIRPGDVGLCLYYQAVHPDVVTENRKRGEQFMSEQMSKLAESVNEQKRKER